jgi:hypothetical protein
VIIEIKQELLDLIEKVVADTKAEHPDADFWWLYNQNGNGAIASVTIGYNIAFELDLSIQPNGSVSAYRREIGRHDYDDLETLKYDSDYEDEELEEEEDE